MPDVITKEDNLRKLLDRIVQALLSADPQIREIVLFGSAGYAPDIARDIDLLIITDSGKDEHLRDISCDFDMDVDLVIGGSVRDISETIIFRPGGGEFHDRFGKIRL